MFNNLTNKEKEAIVKAILKGVTHAVVIPLVLFTFVNISIDGNYGGVVSFVYIATMVYGLLLGILLIGVILSAV